MDKKILFTLLFLIVFMLGCGNLRFPQTTEGEQQQQIGLGFIYAGFQSLEIRFPAGEPFTYYEDQELIMNVELRNRGAKRVKYALKVSGIDTGLIAEDFNIYPDTARTGNLDGKEIIRGMGGFDIVTLSQMDGKVLELPQGTEVHRPNILVTACYNYIDPLGDPSIGVYPNPQGFGTFSTVSICVDPDPFSPYAGKKACEAGHITDLTANQGAPIAVSNIQTNPIKNGIQVKIFLTNADQGTIIPMDYEPYNDCDPTKTKKLRYQDLNMLSNYEVTLGGDKGTCQPIASKLRFVDKSAFIFCTWKGITGTAYVTPLEIRLAYGYMVAEPKTIEIRKI